MILGFNIILLLALILPPLIYAVIIYLTSPVGSVSFRNGLLFMVGGIGSVSILHLLWLLIPGLIPGFYEDPFERFFFSVAPLEELSKYLIFIFIMKTLNKNTVSEHPFRYMFYFSLVGLGFALIENVIYVNTYGQEILYYRTFTSTIAHMLFGMFFGYWIGLSTINQRKFHDRSVFGVLIGKNKILKTIIYTVVGFLTATLYHGLWNYNLSTSKEASNTIMFILVLAGLLASKLLAKELNNSWRRRSTKP